MTGYIRVCGKNNVKEDYYNKLREMKRTVENKNRYKDCMYEHMWTTLDSIAKRGLINKGRFGKQF